MTVKQLMKELRAILKQRGGKDIEVRVDQDFDRLFEIVSVCYVDDQPEEYEEYKYVILNTPSTMKGMRQHDAGFRFDSGKVHLN